MDLFEALILGIVQGTTEWLPISSSGHLAIAQNYLGKPPLIFDIMLHFGTMLILILYFKKEVSAVRRAVLSTFKDMRNGKRFMDAVYEGPDRRLAWFIVIGMIPTAAFGFLLDLTIIDQLYGSMLVVGTCLILTGIILILTARVRGKRKIMKMTSKDAWLVGIAQGLSILPGISRSGSTIGIALLRGIDAETAGRYSFLLAIPSIMGATLLHIPDLFDARIVIDPIAYPLGVLMAMVVGYFTLSLLMRILKGRGFHNFAYYCFFIGTFVLAFDLYRVP